MANKHILIIDMDADICRAIKGAASMHHVDVTFLGSVDIDGHHPSWWILGRGKPVDAVVIAGYIPGARTSSGPEIVRLLRQAHITIPIIGCSGDLDTGPAFAQAGATAFVHRGVMNQPASGFAKALELIQ